MNQNHQMNQFGQSFYSRFRPEGPQAGYRQAAAFLREAIRRGRLHPGERLPSVRQLAECWQLNPSMVTRALKLLEGEQLLQCSAKVGTFVAPPVRSPRRVGIYYTRQLNEQDFHFYALLTVLLQQRLEQRGLAATILCDDRPESEQHTPCPRLLRAIDEGRIDSLIVLMLPQAILDWLPRLGIPLVARGENRKPYVLDWNFRPLFDRLLEHCRSRGAGSVGLLSHVSRGFFTDGSPRILEQFLAAVRDHGLKCRDDWITTPSDRIETGFEHYGYQVGKRFFSRSDLPDAVILYPDVVARGAVAAILKRGGPPTRTQLLIHRHRELEFLVPFPCTFFDNSVAEIADQTLNALLSPAAARPDHDFYQLVPNPLNEKG